ncbi:lasso peptide biosynthesis protein [Actinomadura terrae]|uniref:lasso peptide biosynthesis protein n=1 Tax=Actinomadura terrae TaxID=604353 RepID=UPI001FA7639B|nr:lasso peptide biosynthesis protein [Actinomadura terrae]
MNGKGKGATVLEAVDSAPFPHHVECPAGLNPVPRSAPPDPADGTALRSAPDVHWAWWDDELVALDLASDRFVALDSAASGAVSEALTSEAPPSSPSARRILDGLCARGLLVTAASTDPGWEPVRPTRPGGVSSFAPQPLKGLSTHSAPPPTPATLALAARLLADSEGRLRRHGLLTPPRDARRPRLPEQAGDPGSDELVRARTLVRAHLVVRGLLARPSNPLSAAAALARHAWRMGLPAHLVLGVQKYPFHTRVFVELHRVVLDDAQEVVDALAPILVIGPETAGAGEVSP